MTAGSRESLDVYVRSPEARHRVYRRTLVVVGASQVFGGAGVAAGVTVGALLAQDMLGSTAVTGLPAAVFTVGSAAAALSVGRVSQRWGRRTGLVSGFIAGGVGAFGVVVAAVTGSVPLLFAAMLVYGSGAATSLQARYAGTDLAPADRRGTAVSIAMVSTTLGAVAGPNLVEVMGGVAGALGLPPLAGPFLLSGAAFTVAGLVLLILLRPDPLRISMALAEHDVAAAAPIAPAAPRRVNRGVAVGATVMVLTQIAMVAIMTMTPIHMQQHGHDLGEVGFVISLHIGAMFLPSLVTGVLVDRIGRMPMAIAAGATLLVAGLLAAFAPGDALGPLTVALTLLGLGWNFGLISGTAMIVDATPPATRAATQGSVDLLIALAGAVAGAGSGLVVATAGYPALGLAGGVLSLALIPVVAWARRDPQHPQRTVSTTGPDDPPRSHQRR